MFPERFSRSLLFCLLFVLLIAGQLLSLWLLPYSTSELNYFSAEQITEKEILPTPNFQLGDIQWNVETYRSAPELENFRQYFQQHCNGLQGIKAAVCLSNNFINVIPFGEPEKDFFNNSYSPSKALEQHLKGESGHCVTYSGLTATALLSVGIPATVVQIIPHQKEGHTIINLWDAQAGWTLFDPLNGGLISNGKRYVSGIEAVRSNSALHRERAEPQIDNNGYLKEYYIGDSPFDGVVIYPEPYFYTRVGEKQALPFYRGKFVVFGKNNFFLGDAQNLLRIGIVICLLGLFGAICQSFAALRKK